MDEEFRGITRVGNYEIGNLCYETYPCKHSFKKCSEERFKLLCATDIFTILSSEGLSYPHLDYCREVIRRRDHPTREELEELEARRRQRELNIERQERERQEREAQNGINRASLRLERLRANNNC